MCFLRISSARYLVLRFGSFADKWLGGRTGQAGLFAVVGDARSLCLATESNEQLSGEHPQPGLLSVNSRGVVGIPHLVSRNFGECYQHLTKTILF